MTEGNAWIPGRKRRDCPLSKLKLILNKITEEKFLPLSLEIRTFFEERIVTEADMRGCAESILEKAMKEPHYAALYTQLCIYLTEQRTTFKPILLKTLQTIFQDIVESALSTRTKRLVGCVAVISEFYNLNMLPSEILFRDVMSRLLFEESDSSIEALCIVLTRVWDKVLLHFKTRTSLKMYIQRLSTLQKDENADISSRIRFLLLDVLEKEH
uniref:MIF4G domain protein n=1 Tax=Pithovirus LCPAC304 TaxID=2506594 RepID=A0A481ZAQ2_9VIRU|nr:MAG: MIF4G domain protein [Pithovirus LCPAC304]